MSESIFEFEFEASAKNVSNLFEHKSLHKHHFVIETTPDLGNHNCLEKVPIR
jgi:hypothetical protein